MDALADKPFSAAEFRRRAARERGPYAVNEWGDHRLNPDLKEMIVGNRLRDAAVLIAVVDRAPEATVLLTTRTEHLRSHAGQIAFPGGRIDAEDPTPEFAALRETEEEIGLSPQEVELVGRMPDYISGSGFRIAPVLGIVRPDYFLTLNTVEVEDAFEVPLSFLMDPANHRRDSRIWQNRERYFYVMPFGNRHIWGVTAGIIRTVYERLYL
jgi:8-oxo-dGTP pyrophosphatase MutT (NUDIX family)